VARDRRGLSGHRQPKAALVPSPLMPDTCQTPLLLLHFVQHKFILRLLMAYTLFRRSPKRDSNPREWVAPNGWRAA
jgi:hypothetical protein